MTPLEKLLKRTDKTEIKKSNKIVDEIDALEEKISSLNDEELKRIVDFIESEDDFREYSFFLGMIPPKYQNNIDDFKTDYMDGNYTFEGRHVVDDDE